MTSNHPEHLTLDEGAGVEPTTAPEASVEPTTGTGTVEEPRSSTPTAPSHPEQDPLRGSRTGAFYAATVGLGLVLILVVVFVAQNTASTSVSFLTWTGEFPVAVVILVAFAAGILFTALGGSLRIMQLRRRAKKVEKQRRKAAKAAGR
ncbi:LapA family protein [Nocardioides sp. GY 10127]|uniref:LapA family protein n=1 Tax=Nocardioides sp. GY 10127 TaxID=2569762 RepID=UPI0010A896E9|nr:LapA family protein [Nocardioides sp. GY 10127]TIC84337.1 LapA family protein [Nocardioides sp. GY 10127]